MVTVVRVSGVFDGLHTKSAYKGTKKIPYLQILWDFFSGFS